MRKILHAIFYVLLFATTTFAKFGSEPFGSDITRFGAGSFGEGGDSFVPPPDGSTRVTTSGDTRVSTGGDTRVIY